MVLQHTVLSTPVDLQKNSRLIYDGSKSFWRTRVTIDVIIVEHGLKNGYELAAYDPHEDIEYKRLFINIQSVQALLNPDEMDIRVSALKERYIRAKNRWDEDELCDSVSKNMVYQYLLDHLNSPAHLNEDDKDALTFMQGIDILLKDHDVHFMRKVTETEIDTKMHEYEVESSIMHKEVEKAKRLEEVVLSTVNEFFNLLEKKKKLSLYSSPSKVHWAKALNKVVIKNTVNKITARLAATSTAKLTPKNSEKKATTPSNAAYIVHTMPRLTSPPAAVSSVRPESKASRRIAPEKNPPLKPLLSHQNSTRSIHKLDGDSKSKSSSTLSTSSVVTADDDSSHAKVSNSFDINATRDFSKTSNLLIDTDANSKMVAWNLLTESTNVKLKHELDGYHSNFESGAVTSDDFGGIANRTRSASDGAAMEANTFKPKEMRLLQHITSKFFTMTDVVAKPALPDVTSKRLVMKRENSFNGMRPSSAAKFPMIPKTSMRLSMKKEGSSNRLVRGSSSNNLVNQGTKSQNEGLFQPGFTKAGTKKVNNALFPKSGRFRLSDHVLAVSER